MSIANKPLTKSEISRAFESDDQHRFPPMLTTKEAAQLLRISPKTLNKWKNEGCLEGTYRTQRGRDLYWRDRLVGLRLNGPNLNVKKK